MKKILITGLVIAFAFLAGCKKQLTTDAIGLLTLDQVNTAPTLNTVETAVSSSYELLSSRLNILAEWDWGGGLVFQNDYILQDIASDDMEKKWNADGDQPWMDEINNFTFTSTNGGPNGLWKYDYEGIKRINLAISFLNKTGYRNHHRYYDCKKKSIAGRSLFFKVLLLFLLGYQFWRCAFDCCTGKNLPGSF